MRFVLAVIALAAVAHADDDVEVPGRHSTELRGHALVWEDAAFYVEPWEGGTMVRFAAFGQARREEVGRVVPVKIVAATMRDFVEVEVVGDTTCAWRELDVDRRIAGLHLFVKRSDLAPVLVKPYAIKYPDGTGARLRPGVPVAPTPSGAYVVAARDDVLRLPIPHASVGYTYRLGEVEDPALPAGQLWRLDRVTTVKLGDGELEAHPGWLATKPAKHGETVNLAWSTKCIDLVVGVPARALRKIPRPRAELFGFGGSGRHSAHVIPRGTPLATLGGREVAIADEEIDVAPPADGKACFDAGLDLVHVETRGTVGRTFRLCAPAAAVEGPPVSSETTSRDPLAAPPDVAAPPPDARRTAKGVFWKRLAAGRGGTRPTADSTVLVHYSGWTTDGKLFDSSRKRGQPARFPLRAVIPGWSDALQTMRVGDKHRFWIPEELAYKGAPARPQGMLVFDIELLGVDQ